MYNFKKCLCSQCKKEHQESQCYRHKKTNEIWCLYCLAKLKKEMDIVKYKRSLNR